MGIFLNMVFLINILATKNKQKAPQGNILGFLHTGRCAVSGYVHTQKKCNSFHFSKTDIGDLPLPLLVCACQHILIFLCLLSKNSLQRSLSFQNVWLLLMLLMHYSITTKNNTQILNV